MKLTTEEKLMLKKVAADIGVSVASLYKVIMFESAFRPHAKNPYSSARGLLQWTDSTARGLGYASSADLVAKNPTVVSQLAVAKKHFAKMAPFSSEHEFFMANFLPAFRHYPKETPLLSLPNGEKYAKANPGIKTLADYTKKARAVKVPADLVSDAGKVAIPILIGAATVFFCLVVNCTIQIKSDNVDTTIKPVWVQNDDTLTLSMR